MNKKHYFATNMEIDDFKYSKELKEAEKEVLFSPLYQFRMIQTHIGLYLAIISPIVIFQFI